MTRHRTGSEQPAIIHRLSDIELEQRITDTAAHAHSSKRFDRLVFERERRRRVNYRRILSG
jgi:hypothetical protein